ncbi:MAG: hypothetical protein ACI93T_003706, partial [Porticoccaceae bacterium]
SRRLSPAGETVTLFNYSADISITSASFAIYSFEFSGKH